MSPTRPGTELPASDKVVMGLLLFASQATNIKLADIQIFEWLSLALLPYLIWRTGGRLRGPALYLFLPFVIFCAYSSIFALFTVEFFPPPNISPLKTPMVLSFIRLAQVSLIFLVFNFLWDVVNSRSILQWSSESYVRISTWIAALCNLSFLVAFATGISSPMVYDTAPYLVSPDNPIGTLRARGLFFEGGPYGLSLLVTFSLMFIMGRTGRKWHPLVWANLLAAMLLAQSKAAFAALLVILLIYILHSLDFRKLMAAGGGLVLLVAGLVFIDNPIKSGVENYGASIRMIASAEITPTEDDGNQAMGRMAAFFIAPRMFIDHPWMGVGMGNYSLARNNPRYLGFLPASQGWDLSGLGLFTILLENGTVGLMVLLLSYLAFFLAIRRARGSRAPPAYEPLFWFPLVLQVAGVQVYFAYHWLFLLLWAKTCLLEHAPDPGHPRAAA